METPDLEHRYRQWQPRFGTRQARKKCCATATNSSFELADKTQPTHPHQNSETKNHEILIQNEVNYLKKKKKEKTNVKDPSGRILLPSLHLSWKITGFFHLSLFCVWLVSRPHQEQQHHKSLRHKSKQIILLVCEGLETSVYSFTVLLRESKNFWGNLGCLTPDYCFTMQHLFAYVGSQGCLGNGSIWRFPFVLCPLGPFYLVLITV